MNFIWEDFSPKENAKYGEEIAKGAAHLAVRKLFDQRIDEGKSQEQIAQSIGKDPAWLSRIIKGPANWTLKTLGALLVALDGELSITVTPEEDVSIQNIGNYDAYVEMDEHCLLMNKMSIPITQPIREENHEHSLLIFNFGSEQALLKTRYHAPIMSDKKIGSNNEVVRPL